MKIEIVEIINRGVANEERLWLKVLSNTNLKYFIVLYTKPGMSSEELNNDGTTTHFLYWGLDKTVWNNTGDCAVLFELNTWQTSKYGE